MITNTQIAELFARLAENAESHRQRAFRRASRHALLWPEEAASVHAEGRPLTELSAVGPRLAARMRQWIEETPEIPEPPPLRRGFISVAQARAILEQAPLWRDRLRGDLQMHTLHSDGATSILAMAITGVGFGYDYVAITDHTKGLKIAGGMDEAQLAAQLVEIDEANATLAGEGVDFTVLKSVELNFDAAGVPDMPPDSLAGLDLVVGSFHSLLRRNEDQTKRCLAAVADPSVDVLGHPRGRKYSLRMGVLADWEAVLDAALTHDKALEIDGFPDRQDLGVDLLPLAAEAGVWISISTDAHNPAEMEFMEVGLACAAASGISPDRVLNLKTADEIKAWAADHR